MASPTGLTIAGIRDLLMPVVLGTPAGFGLQTNATQVLPGANGARGARFVAPRSGVVKDIHVFNGSVSAGNTDVCIMDTAVTNRNVLYSAGSTASTGTNRWQTFTANLAVSEGQHFDVGVSSDSATATFGSYGLARTEIVNSLPAAFGTLAPAGGANTLVWGPASGAFPWGVAGTVIAESTLTAASVVILVMVRLA